MAPQYRRSHQALLHGPAPPPPGLLPLRHGWLESGRPHSGTQPEWLRGLLNYPRNDPKAGPPTRSSLQPSALRMVGVGGDPGGLDMPGCSWDAA
jgi:hypothetical protein